MANSIPYIFREVRFNCSKKKKNLSGDLFLKCNILLEKLGCEIVWTYLGNGSFRVIVFKLIKSIPISLLKFFAKWVLKNLLFLV